MGSAIRIAILANGSQARAEAAATARAYGVMGKSVSRVGKLVAGAFAVSALVRVGTAVGKVGAQYVDSLNKIQALTGSTDAQMDRLASSLESQAGAFAKFGQTTGDAAAGMVELTKSGLSANKALGAIRGTMLLAKAGELDVADASSLVANTLNTFGLKAKYAAHIANSLANAANVSSADVSDLAESFKYVSPLAAKAGVSVDQTNAILAELANSGIKASQAGTSLRSFLLSLQAPSSAGAQSLSDLNVQVYDAQGNMKPIPALLDSMNRGLGKLSEAGQNAALKNIFGKIGITGAQVILKNGSKGLQDTTEKVKALGGATRVAESATKGLAGTLLSIKANAISVTQSLYRQLSPAIDDALRGSLGWLSDHKDDFTSALSAFGSVITDHVAPAMESLANLAADAVASLGSGSGGGLAGALGRGLLAALSTFADLTKTAADALDRLPDPIKSIAVQAGIAALIFPRLSAGIASVSGSMITGAASARAYGAALLNVETRSTAVGLAALKMSSGLKTAAGIGGMVALAQGASQTNDKLKLLANVGGGALLGFQIGGPIGAAVGGTAGALLTLAENAGKAGETAKLQIPKFEGMADSLDGITAAATEATKTLIFQNLASNGSLQTLNQYGISSRVAVAAIMGEKGAREQVTAAIGSERAMRNAALTEAAKLQREYDSIIGTGTAEEEQRQSLAKTIQAWKDEATAHDQVIKSIQKATGTFRAETREKRAQIAATKDYAGLLKGLPAKAVTKIRADGIEPTKRAVVQLAARYRLTPKQIQTTLKAAGFKGTSEQVKDVLRQLGRLDQVKPNMGKALRSVQQFSLQAKREAIEGGQGVTTSFKQETGKAKANLNPFVASVRAGVGPAKAAATAGGQQVGANLKDGVLAGFSGTAAALAAMAASAVRSAIAAAKAAAKIKSPSQVMRDEVGKMLGEGLVVGLREKADDAEHAAAALVARLIRGVTRGSDGIKSALSKIGDLVEKTEQRQWDRIEKNLRKHFKGKELAKRLAAEKRAWREHAKVIDGIIKSERAALLANGKAQDRNARLLEKAVASYKDLVQRANEFADGIRSGFASFGSIVGLGAQEDGTVSITALVEQLKVKAQQARAFSKIIDSLRGKLNATSLQQLLDQAASGDITGALATAQAIAGGGQSVIDEINALATSISAAGNSLAEKMRGDFYGAGIQAAQGLIDGLKKRQADLDKIAERLAERLIEKIKKMLGIKSPSRAFREIGDQSIAGLALSFRSNDAHVRRIGASAAAALTDGFGDPRLATSALDAWNKARSSSLDGNAEAARVEKLLISIQAELVKLNTTEKTAHIKTGQALADAINDRAGNRSRKG